MRRVRALSAAAAVAAAAAAIALLAVPAGADEEPREEQGCTYEWQVLVTLLAEDGWRGDPPTMEEIVARSVSDSAGPMFNAEATVQLTWAVARAVGEQGRLEIDWRVTSQAWSMGVWPGVHLTPFFRDPVAGLAMSELEATLKSEVRYNSGDGTPGLPGWNFSLNMTRMMNFRPMHLRTTSDWDTSTSKILICDTNMVLRMPMLELTKLTTDAPFVVLGSSLPPRDRPGVAPEDTMRESFAFARAGVWDRLDLNTVMGLSWVWFLVASGGSQGQGIAVWASSTAFRHSNVQVLPSLDLGFIFPFTWPRSDVEHEWDLEPFDESIYDELPEKDTYLEDAITATTPWYTGPCARYNNSWVPQLLSFGSVFVVSSSWGLAYRSARDVAIDSPLLNYEWEVIAPYCGVVFPNNQVNSASPQSSCTFFFVPSNATSTAEGHAPEGSFADTETLELPSLLRVSGSYELCFAGDSEDGASPEDGIVSAEQVRDQTGKTLAQALGPDAAQWRVAGVVAQTTHRGSSGAIVLLRDGQRHRIVSLESGVWESVFVFPEAGFVPRVPGPESTFERVPGTRHGAEERAGAGAEHVPYDLQMIQTIAALGTGMYVWGNQLLFSPSNGRSFWNIAQAPRPRDVGAHWLDLSDMGFDKDPIKALASSADGWVAVLTEKCAVWAGQVGSPTVFLLEQSVCEAFGLVAPLSLSFSESNELLVMGLTPAGATGELRVLDTAVQLELGSLRTMQAAEQSAEGCDLDNVLVFAQHMTGLVRKLYSREGFLREELVEIQDSTFFNELPKKIFLDLNSEYSFVVRLYPAFNPATQWEIAEPGFARERAWAFEDMRLGFELATEGLVSLHVERVEDYVQNLIEYHVEIRDLGAWGKLVNSSSEPFSQGGERSNVSATPGELYSYGLPGIDLSLSIFRINGLSRLCGSHVSPSNVVSHQLASQPLQLNIYSGCPPQQKIVFDAELTRAKVDNGCIEGEEDICFFYANEFEPVFKVVDEVTGAAVYRGASFGVVRVIGGGLTFDTIEDYPAESVDSLSNQVLTPASVEDLDKLRFFCLVKGSPCYAIPSHFPEPPQYFFKILFKSNSRSSYCDHTTTFVVRVHNLPITIEEIVTTNLITILVLLVPIMCMFYRRQQQIRRRLMRVEDVDLTRYSKRNEQDYSDSDDADDSDSDSDDDLSDSSRDSAESG